MTKDLEKRVETLEARLEAYKLAVSILLGRSSSDAYEQLEASSKTIVGAQNLKPQTLVELEELLAVFAQVRNAP